MIKLQLMGDKNIILRYRCKLFEGKTPQEVLESNERDPSIADKFSREFFEDIGDLRWTLRDLIIDTRYQSCKIFHVILLSNNDVGVIDSLYRELSTILDIESKGGTFFSRPRLIFHISNEYLISALLSQEETKGIYIDNSDVFYIKEFEKDTYTRFELDNIGTSLQVIDHYVKKKDIEL